VRDQRIDKLADVLVRYSAKVKQGDLVRLAGEPIGMDLLVALYEACLRAGSHPYIKAAPDAAQQALLEIGSDEQLTYVNPLAKAEVEKIDVAISLWAETNTKALSGVDPQRQTLASTARRELMSRFMQRAADGELNWCGTLFPTAANAQDAEMSLRAYEDFVFNAGHINTDDPVAVWQAIEARQQKVVDYLTGKKELRYQAPNGTDLTVNVTGMTWINCCGHENFPDGEVFTGPNLDAPDGGVNGYVRYSFPAVHHGREVHDIELWFEKGRVVNCNASKNLGFLKAMLDQDQGARRLGEIAIGTNYQITRYTKNTLFDEKIGGTFHAAVGAGYPETGNANESALHWDMVCDLRSAENGGTNPDAGGTITVDGEVISKDGRFVFDGWPGPEA